jgi:hypothetical protein
MSAVSGCASIGRASRPVDPEPEVTARKAGVTSQKVQNTNVKLA